MVSWEDRTKALLISSQWIANKLLSLQVSQQRLNFPCLTQGELCRKWNMKLVCVLPRVESRERCHLAGPERRCHWQQRAFLLMNGRQTAWATGWCSKGCRVTAAFWNLVIGSGEQLMKQAGPREKKCVHLSWGVAGVSLWHECKFCRLQAAEVSGWSELRGIGATRFQPTHSSPFLCPTCQKSWLN